VKWGRLRALQSGRLEDVLSSRTRWGKISKKDSVLVLIEAGSGAEAVAVGLSVEWRWDA
jgi:hypothetical protein